MHSPKRCMPIFIVCNQKKRIKLENIFFVKAMFWGVEYFS